MIATIADIGTTVWRGASMFLFFVYPPDVLAAVTTGSVLESGLPIYTASPCSFWMSTTSLLLSSTRFLGIILAPQSRPFGGPFTAAFAGFPSKTITLAGFLWMVLAPLFLTFARLLSALFDVPFFVAARSLKNLFWVISVVASFPCPHRLGMFGSRCFNGRGNTLWMAFAITLLAFARARLIFRWHPHLPQMQSLGDKSGSAKAGNLSFSEWVISPLLSRQLC